MEIKRISSAESHLVIALFDSYRVFYKQQSDIAAAEKFIKARLDNDESIIFVAFETINGEIKPTGFTQLYPGYSSVRITKSWILNDLYVDAQYRKQGVGEKLIRTAMIFAKETGAKYIQLETAVDNYVAQSLYDSIGFIRQPADMEYYTYRMSID